MKPLQQDDIQDWLNQPKRKWNWLHITSGKTVKAESKKEAAEILFQEHKIVTSRKLISRI